MTTSTATGIQTLVAPTPNVDPLAGAKGGADPSAGTVMVAGPKVAVGVGNYPEYNEIKAKNGGKDLTRADYRDILNQVAVDLPNLFTDELLKSGNKKVSTYINTLLKEDLVQLSEKILKEKYVLSQSTSKLQDVSARSVLSRDYRNTKIAVHELQDVMRRGIAANKYKDLLNTTIRAEKNPAFVNRIQTQFRSHLARQEFERQKLIGVPAGANPSAYQLYPSNVIDPTSSFVTEADFEAFMNSFGV
jgi:hypothetical protein